MPKEVVKELLLSGALDKDINLTNDEGNKTSFKESLLTLKNSEETNTQPSHTPIIKPIEPEKTEPEKESIKTLSEIFEKWMVKDGKFKEQVIAANKINSSSISTSEVAMLRKHQPSQKTGPTLFFVISQLLQHLGIKRRTW